MMCRRSSSLTVWVLASGQLRARRRHNGPMHLAQLNVGRLRAPMDDPAIDDFRENLAPVNALAEASPGFVWRLQDGSGNATGIKPYGDDLEIVNVTVWTSVEALADFSIPTVAEAIVRLDHLRAHGPTLTAFTFRHRFDPDAEAEAAGDRDVCPA